VGSGNADSRQSLAFGENSPAAGRFFVARNCKSLACIDKTFSRISISFTRIDKSLERKIFEIGARKDGSPKHKFRLLPLLPQKPSVSDLFVRAKKMEMRENALSMRLTNVQLRAIAIEVRAPEICPAPAFGERNLPKTL
jgi:hypothetical protein